MGPPRRRDPAHSRAHLCRTGRGQVAAGAMPTRALRRRRSATSRSGRPRRRPAAQSTRALRRRRSATSRSGRPRRRPAAQSTRGSGRSDGSGADNMGSPMAEVVFAGVGKSYGETRVIEGLDLEIRDRELMVLVGPSGCGKSTALRMIAGLEDVTSGTISIGGRVVNDLPPKDRDIAMVFQSYALYPHMTVRENLEFGLKMRKTPRAEIDRLVGAAAEVLGLADLLARKPKQLSGGQRQRVAVGRA